MRTDRYFTGDNLILNEGHMDGGLSRRMAKETLQTMNPCIRRKMEIGERVEAGAATAI